MDIEWKEGAVCYAYNRLFFLDEHYHSLISRCNLGMDLEYALRDKSFILNEPRPGWYIPKSELDTEDKYNQAVKVFGLFGWFGHFCKPSYVILQQWENLCVNAMGELWVSDIARKTKITFEQLMAIGKLKRMMIERGEPQPEIAEALSNDNVRTPSHYNVLDGIESIEIIARSMTQEQWKGFCLGNILKYRIRAGKKDAFQQDIDKANFYGELYEIHKDKCYK